MENWFNKLLELDEYPTLAHHNKNDEQNKVIVFPMKQRFHFYESLGDSKGETCFIKKSAFKSYMEDAIQTSLLDIVVCEDFLLEVNDSKQLKGINSKSWGTTSFYEEHGNAPFLNSKYNLRGGNHSLFCLGRNIKHDEYKDYDGEGYSYVMLYYDNVMNMYIVFKSTYHEVDKKDLSFETFKENKDNESKMEELTLDEAIRCERVDTDYLFTKMSDSHLFNKLLDHPIFKYELKNSPGLKSHYIRLHDEINPKKKWRLGLNYSNSDSR